MKAYYSLADMIDGEPDLEIVDVTTGGNENGSWHYEPTMEALEKGKHVLVEKPISNDIGQAREMVALATDTDLYLGCNLNHYFTPPAEQAKKYIDNGQIGEMVYVLHKMGFAGGEFNYSYSKAPRSDGFPYFHVKAFSVASVQCDASFLWRRDACAGFYGAAHIFAVKKAILWSLLTAFTSVFENGCIGYLLSQRGDATFGLGGWWSVELAGTRGTFCIENCIEKITFWPSPGAPEGGETVVTESGISDFGQTFPLRIHAFLEDITNGVPKEKIRASGRDALAALEYTWAAMESYEQGGILVRPHPLPPLSGL